MSPKSGGKRQLAPVTGAGRGLGRVLAEFLAGEGFDLILDARSQSDLRSVSQSLSRWNRTVQIVPGDVSDPDHRRVLRAAVRKNGHLDLLVNNASELGPSPLPPLSRVPLRAFERILAVNLLAPVALVQELKPFLERARGLVVNISSDAAVGGNPGWGAYGASKAALDLVSKTLANELKESGIAFVSVDPGDMRTAMHQMAFPGDDISDRPLPEITVPFWAWLLGQDSWALSGRRFQAQADHWEAPEL